MIILGIDPGTRRVGFGAIEYAGGKLVLREAGLLRITASDDSRALLEIKSEMDKLIRQFRPERIAVERLFFSKNQKTGIAVAQARGVILLAAETHGIPLCEFTPTEVKMALAGYGGADKSAILKMTRILLNEPALKVIDDASDALALAIAGSRKSLESL